MLAERARQVDMLPGLSFAIHTFLRAHVLIFALESSSDKVFHKMGQSDVAYSNPGSQGGHHGFGDGFLAPFEVHEWFGLQKENHVLGNGLGRRTGMYRSFHVGIATFGNLQNISTAKDSLGTC